MKKQLNQLRRFFARTSAKRLNAATAREAIPASYDEDDSDTRLSGAFVVVLILHIVALIGVFAFSRIREKNPVTQPKNEAANSAPSALAATTTPAPATGEPPAIPTTPASAATLPEPGAAPQLAADGVRHHFVKTGENITRIALAYGVRTTDIVSANKLKNQDDLKPGQDLIIPAVQSTPPAPEPKSSARTETKSMPPTKVATTVPSTYTMKKGDTLTKIARELGVTYDDLAKANNIKDPRKLQPGQVLKVPKKK